MTDSTPNPVSFTEFNLAGHELQHLQAIGKLMSCYNPSSFPSAEGLNSDEINRLGDMIIFLTQCRMSFDEFTDQLFESRLKTAIRTARKRNRRKGRK
jgi:hypothetical protein